MLVLGATGVSGGLAVQVAHRFGARVVAAGRDRGRLAETLDRGADAVIELADLASGLGAAAPDGIDVVLDYAWGEPAAAAIDAIVRTPRDPALPIEHVQLGATAGRHLPLDAAALRSRSLRVTGSGLGSVDGPTMLRAVGGVLEAAAVGALSIAVEVHPLAEVASAWHREARLVFVP